MEYSNYFPVSDLLVSQDGRQASQVPSRRYPQQEEATSSDTGFKWHCVSFLLLIQGFIVGLVIFSAFNELKFIVIIYSFYLTLIKIRIETEEEFRVTMDKIPDYRIEEEDVDNREECYITDCSYAGGGDLQADLDVEEHHEGAQAEEEGAVHRSHGTNTGRVREKM